jgi:hypothetical protein
MPPSSRSVPEKKDMPTRTKKEIKKDLNETLQLLDRLAMEIAPLCAKYFWNNDKSVETTLKKKADTFRKVKSTKTGT